MKQPLAHDDAMASNAQVIELHVAELRQLFNAMDPAPFHARDLDPRAEEYIVSWARELPREAPLALLVHLDRAAGPPDEVAVLRTAIQQFFADRGVDARRRLRQLFHRGRVSLVIGLAFLAGALVASELIGKYLQPSGFLNLLRESLLIGGWVAMWRPIEVFLYDWWPIRAEARLFDRLAAMPVSVKYGSAAASEAWRRDWPATAASKQNASAFRS
jgi:hypothetical protein